MRQGVAPAQVRAICGWQDSDTMEHYMNLAGIGVRGATANHRIIPNKAAMARFLK